MNGGAISAPDKYTLQVTGGLTFAEFRGYEGWPVIAISENGGKIAVILGNSVMIDAFREGVPGNGKPFPDGAKMNCDPGDPFCRPRQRQALLHWAYDSRKI